MENQKFESLFGQVISFKTPYNFNKDEEELVNNLTNEKWNLIAVFSPNDITLDMLAMFAKRNLPFLLPNLIMHENPNFIALVSNKKLNDSEIKKVKSLTDNPNEEPLIIHVVSDEKLEQKRKEGYFVFDENTTIPQIEGFLAKRKSYTENLKADKTVKKRRAKNKAARKSRKK
jgi:hypothetical protein